MSLIQVFTVLVFTPVCTQYGFLKGLLDAVWKRQSEKRPFLIKRSARAECFASDTGMKNSFFHIQNHHLSYYLDVATKRMLMLFCILWDLSKRLSWILPNKTQRPQNYNQVAKKKAFDTAHPNLRLISINFYYLY